MRFLAVIFILFFASTSIGGIAFDDFEIRGVLSVNSGAGASPSLTFRSDTDTGLFLESDAVLGFSVGGSKAMALDSDLTLELKEIGSTPTDCAESGFFKVYKRDGVVRTLDSSCVESVFGGGLSDGEVTTAKLADEAVTDVKTDLTAPTVQRFTSGTGTYTTPAGVKWIRVTAVGAGGGGAGSGGSGGGSGSSGSNTLFGTSLLNAGGGIGAAWQQGLGGNGGTGSLGGADGFVISGSKGGGGSFTGSSTYQAAGGNGGVSFFGGAGAGGFQQAGTSAATNSGSGGAGGGSSAAANTYVGPGGGAGAYLQATISSPAASYSYTVGAGGGGGTAGSSGYAGGSGANGLIIVEEFYY